MSKESENVATSENTLKATTMVVTAIARSKSRASVKLTLSDGRHTRIANAIFNELIENTNRGWASLCAFAIGGEITITFEQGVLDGVEYGLLWKEAGSEYIDTKGIARLYGTSEFKFVLPNNDVPVLSYIPDGKLASVIQSQPQSAGLATMLVMDKVQNAPALVESSQFGDEE